MDACSFYDMQLRLSMLPHHFTAIIFHIPFSVHSLRFKLELHFISWRSTSIHLLSREPSKIKFVSFILFSALQKRTTRVVLSRKCGFVQKHHQYYIVEVSFQSFNLYVIDIFINHLFCAFILHYLLSKKPINKI